MKTEMSGRKPRSAEERTSHSGEVYCKEPGCEEHTKADKWNKIRSADEGWFFSREGWATCPAHKPDWLDKWREK